MDRKEVIQLPVLPESIPLFDFSFNNEEFETLEGTINLKNYKRNLFAATIESFLPSVARKYRWLKSDLDYKIATLFFLDAINFKKPVRYIVIGSTSEELTNILVTIESFTTTSKRNKDVSYYLSIKEFREVK